MGNDQSGNEVVRIYRDASSKYSGKIGEIWIDCADACSSYIHDCHICETRKELHLSLQKSLARDLMEQIPAHLETVVSQKC